MVRTGWLALASAAALACAGAPPAPMEMPTSGEVSGGEVFFIPAGSSGTSAAFDVRRVIGPTVNMGTTPEGAWGGDLLGQNLVLEITDGQFSSATLRVVVSREGDGMRLGGIVGSRRFSVTLSPRRFQGTIDGGTCSFDLPREVPGLYRGFISCSVRGERSPEITSTVLKLSGDAVRLDAPVMPQLALAILAVLPL